MRLFFAGDIPAEQRALIVKTQGELKRIKSDIKWVEPQNLHITLRFIGEVNGKLLRELEKIGKEVGKLYGSFDISLKGLGTFPPKGPPRVLWIGIEEGKKQTTMVASALDARLSKLKIKLDEHEFKAHITLGRFKTPRIPEELVTAIAADTTQSEPWHLEAFALKESNATKAGPTYKNIYTFKLAPKERLIHAAASELWSEKTTPAHMGS